VALTQPRAAGAHTGARYGSFAGKPSPGGGSAHPVGLLTQAVAFGAGAGGRYGSFAGRAAAPPAPAPDAGRGGSGMRLRTRRRIVPAVVPAEVIRPELDGDHDESDEAARMSLLGLL
jgi:hypothetical protein